MRETYEITIRGLKIANYMIDHSCEMIAVKNVPENLKEARMIFRAENVYDIYNRATSMYFPELTETQKNRLHSMLTLLIWIKKENLKEERLQEQLPGGDA